MSKIRVTATAVLLALSGSLTAQTIVTVNGTKIDSQEVERRAKAVQSQTQGQIQDSPQLRQAIASEMVTETVIVQEARRLKLNQSSEYKAAEAEALKEAKSRGLDKQAGFKQSWEDYQSHLLVLAYADSVLKKNPVKDADVQKRYSEIKSRYQNTDEVELGELVTDKAEQTQAALKELAAKKKFSDVAKKYSIDPEAKTTGGIVKGFASLVDLKADRPRIYEAVSGLSKGQYTKNPLQEQQISVIFYMNDRRKITVPSLDQVKDNIRAGLADERVQQAVTVLMQKATITPAK